MVFDSTIEEYAMPRIPRAPRKRSRAGTRAKSPAKLHDLVFDMEVPLNEAIDHVVALRLIGCGLTTDDRDNGRAIVTTSWAASQQLDALKDIWRKMLRIEAAG